MYCPWESRYMSESFVFCNSDIKVYYHLHETCQLKVSLVTFKTFPFLSVNAVVLLFPTK